MATFIEIDYDLFLDIYEIANANNHRLRFNNPAHSFKRNSFIELNKIDLSLVAKAMDQLGINHMKMAIIEKGRGAGFYIYSLEKEISYKYKKTDKYLFERDSWGSSDW